jgi:hypothetical protein
VKFCPAGRTNIEAVEGKCSREYWDLEGKKGKVVPML